MKNLTETIRTNLKEKTKVIVDQGRNTDEAQIFLTINAKTVCNSFNHNGTAC